MAESAYMRKYTKGDIIVEEGGAAGEMFIILSGTAGVFKNYRKDNEIHLATLMPSNFFGEMSLFLKKRRSATVVALNDIELIAVDDKNANTVFISQPDMIYTIMGELCKRVNRLNKNYEVIYNEKVGIEHDKRAIFPERHKYYSLNLLNENDTYLYEEKYKCPLCGCSFEQLTVIYTRLKRESTDNDLRNHYVDIEPMYYEVVSCPDCLYSASADLFPNASTKSLQEINQRLQPHLSEIDIEIGVHRDSLTVFAGYYLAILCAPFCFDDYQLHLANLWLKLSRIYSDCGDEPMYLMAAENALKEYEYVYKNFKITETQTQQICFIIGDLYERLKNYEQAMYFFRAAKLIKEGAPIMKMYADRRLEGLKDARKK